MTGLESAIHQAIRDLDSLQSRYALIGGLAVSVRSEPRFTRDIDLAVAVSDDAEAETLVRSLQDCGYRVKSQVEQETVNRLAMARLYSPAPNATFILDLLFASSGIEREIVESADTLEVMTGVIMPVARREHLIALKVLAVDDRRPQDQADLLALTSAASRDEIEAARELLSTIQTRGYHREKQLLKELESYLDRR